MVEGVRVVHPMLLAVGFGYSYLSFYSDCNDCGEACQLHTVEILQVSVPWKSLITCCPTGLLRNKKKRGVTCWSVGFV